MHLNGLNTHAPSLASLTAGNLYWRNLNDGLPLFKALTKFFNKRRFKALTKFFVKRRK